MSKIKLQNANGTNAEVIIENPDSNTSKRTIKVSDIMAKTDTIATLRAMTETPETVWVSGYHTKDDGAFGSHFFRWNKDSVETDNGGTIIKLDGVATGRYELQYDGAVNVRWFGAVGDGVTDDTNAIQSAIDHSATIYVHKGIYNITSPLYIKDNTRILGNNKKDTIIIKSTSSLGVGGNTHSQYGFISYEVDSVIICKFNDDTFATEIEISNISLQGTSPTNRRSYGIFMPLISNFVLNNLDIRFTNKSIYSKNGWQGNISNVLMYSGESGIYFDGGTSIVVTRCFATSMSTYGYYLHLAYSSLQGCAADGNEGTSYYIYNSTSISLISCGNEDSKQAIYITGTNGVVETHFNKVAQDNCNLNMV